MSSTESRNGQVVWDALCSVVRELPIVHDGWVTVGEVARKSGKSKQTVRKYLRSAAEGGYLRIWCDRHGMELYKIVEGE